MDPNSLNDDDFYRPRSPDLTNDAHSGADPPLHPQHQQYRGSISLHSPYTPTGVLPPGGSYFSSRTPTTPYQQSQQNPFFRRPSWTPAGSARASFSAQGGIAPGQIPDQSPLTGFANQTQNIPTHIKSEDLSFDMARAKREPDFAGASSSPRTPVSQARGRGRAAKKEVKYEENDDPMILDEKDAKAERELPEGAAGVEIKTKFPVARIKRIMQADEDVGKVALVTPVVVSKALELFMISLVTKSANEAKIRGSKRVTASHLKQAIMSNEQFDFLHDVVANVPDAPPPGQAQPAPKGGDDSDEDFGTSEVKKKKPGRRKKVAELED